MASTVRNDPGHARFEIVVDGAVAGVAEYRVVDDTVVFTHTEVDDDHEGEGLGGQLVGAALDAVRAAGQSVVALCPFVASFIEHHGEYADLVDQRLTAQLGA